MPDGRSGRHRGRTQHERSVLLVAWDEAVRLVAAHRWSVARTTKRGYLIMLLLRHPPGDVAQDPIEPPTLRAEGSAHDLHAFTTDTVSKVFVVEIAATLGAVRRLTDDDITDIIEAVIDDLDRLPVEPSVGTVGNGEDVDVTVTVTVDQVQELDALAYAISAVKAAFRAAGIGTAGLVPLRDLRSRVLPLQSQSA